MAATTQTTVFLGEYETKTLLEVESRAAGTTFVKMMLRGNSLLSSVFVKSITAGATLAVNYFDTTTGDEATPERFNLNSHALITDTAAGTTFRILVPRIHNKPQLEVIVTGGTVEFGVYATLVGDFPLSGNIIDGQLANLLADGGIPISVYDPGDGKFYLLRGASGFIGVDVEGPGQGIVLEATASIATGPEASILSSVVPVGKTWRMAYGAVVCRGYGRWRLTVDGARIAGGATGPEKPHDEARIPRKLEATAGQTVELFYTYNIGPPGMPIDAFVGLVEV
jgi:hypothetical protein